MLKEFCTQIVMSIVVQNSKVQAVAGGPIPSPVPFFVCVFGLSSGSRRVHCRVQFQVQSMRRGVQFQVLYLFFVFFFCFFFAIWMIEFRFKNGSLSCPISSPIDEKCGPIPSPVLFFCVFCVFFWQYELSSGSRTVHCRVQFQVQSMIRGVNSKIPLRKKKDDFRSSKSLGTALDALDCIAAFILKLLSHPGNLCKKEEVILCFNV